MYIRATYIHCTLFIKEHLKLRKAEDNHLCKTTDKAVPKPFKKYSFHEAF